VFKGENTVNGLYIYELLERVALRYVYSCGQNKFPVMRILIAWGLWEATHAYSWPQCTGQLKCDGTRAETRFCLSVKRTSPFKSAGASVVNYCQPRCAHQL